MDTPGGADDAPTETTQARPAGAASFDADHITTSTRDPEQIGRQLQGWLAGMLPPGSEPGVTDVASPEGNGMSSETILFTARWMQEGAPVEHRCAARIEPAPTAYPVFPRYDLEKQYRVMRLVGEATDVPVPETLWFEPDRSVLGVPFFVMRRVDGRIPPDVLPYTFGDNWVYERSDEDRSRIQESAVRALAGIHVITPETHDLGFLGEAAPGEPALRSHLESWRSYLDWVVGDRPSPLLTDGFAWLEEHFPSDTGAPALSWGDSRIGNMIFDGNDVVAVLDWEMAAIAPPEVDVGWMCYLHMFFQDLAVQLGVPGLPGMFRPAEVAASYERASGRSLGGLKWHVAYAAIRHGVIMRRVTERAVFFGEAIVPDDIDDMIMHRSTIQEMLDGSYWSARGL